jgi:hypothetical protein
VLLVTTSYRTPPDLYGEDWRRFYVAALSALIQSSRTIPTTADGFATGAAHIADALVEQLKKREAK